MQRVQTWYKAVTDNNDIMKPQSTGVSMIKTSTRFKHRTFTIIFQLALTVYWLSGCHDSTSASKQVEKKPALSVYLDRGVEGSHITGVREYSIGEKVSYDFRALKGFDNIVVLASIDANATDSLEYLDPAGVITMDRDYSLWVSADSIIEIPDEDFALREAVLQLLNSDDPVKDYQNLINLMTTEKEGVHERLERIIHATINLDEERQILDRLAEKLEGNMFFISEGVGHADTTAAADPITPPQPAGAFINETGYTFPNHILQDENRDTSIYPPDINPSTIELKEEPVTLVHINGILTDPISALRSTSRLSEVLESMVWPAQIPYRLLLLYNTSSITRERDPNASLFRCLSSLADRVKSIGVIAAPLHLAKCTGKAIKDVVVKYDDIRQAAAQYFKLMMSIHSPESHALTVADSASVWRHAGEHVVLLPHSQGNMMVQEAVNELNVRGLHTPSKDKTCVGTVSMAAPLSSHWTVHSDRLIGFATEGDLILELKTNQFPQIATPAYNKAQREINHWKESNLLLATYQRIIWGIRMHEFVSGYLEHEEVTTRLKESVIDIYKSCAVNQISISPAYILQRIDQPYIPFTVSLTDFFNRPLVGTRDIKWARVYGPQRPGMRAEFGRKSGEFYFSGTYLGTSVFVGMTSGRVAYLTTHRTVFPNEITLNPRYIFAARHRSLY